MSKAQVLRINKAEYLKARGWKLYRTAWEGKPSQWLAPDGGKVYPINEAFSLERANEEAHYKAKETA